MKLDTQALITAILGSVNPYRAVQRHVVWQAEQRRLVVDGRAFDLANKQVCLVAVGKAAVPMAQAMHDLLGEAIAHSVVATKYGHADAALVGRYPWTLIEAAHPVPDDNSLRAGEAIVEVLQRCKEDSIVIVCVSGGASALVVAPQTGISLKTMQAINDALLRSGADIREMNAVRSRLDRLKGGGLVRMVNPAQVIGLILSDVIGDPLEVIASGITNNVGAYNVLVGNNTQACEAAQAELTRQGYNARIITTQMRGEARERGVEIAQAIGQEPQGSALIYGGETTVTIRGTGKGGRSQEMALAALNTLDGDSTLMAFGTDGTDGPTDAAGAIANADGLARAHELNLDTQAYLDNNDSYAFFDRIGGLIKTGPTGTNVADVVIAVRNP